MYQDNTTPSRLTAISPKRFAGWNWPNSKIHFHVRDPSIWIRSIKHRQINISQQWFTIFCNWKHVMIVYRCMSKAKFQNRVCYLRKRWRIDCDCSWLPTAAIDSILWIDCDIVCNIFSKEFRCCSTTPKRRSLSLFTSTNPFQPPCIASTHFVSSIKDLLSYSTRSSSSSKSFIAVVRTSHSALIS